MEFAETSDDSPEIIRPFNQEYTMRNIARIALSAFLLACMAAPAIAKNATNTTVSVLGTVKPGSTVIVRAVLTGSHIISCPYPTYPGAPNCFPGGQVGIQANGTSIRSDAAGVWNSNYGCSPVYAPPFDTICHGDLTIVEQTFAFPKGTSTTAFKAIFSGDHDADGSTSQILTVKAQYPNIQQSINLLLND